MASPTIELKELLETTTRLVAIDTANPPGNELAAAEWCACWLAERGVETVVVPHTVHRASVVARLPGGHGPRLLLCSHLDTAPLGGQSWRRPPLQPTVEEDRIYGLGACDAKGGVAALMCTLSTLARQQESLSADIVLALSAGQESDCLGARQLLGHDWLRDTGFIVVAAPTDNQVCIAEKGALWLRFVTLGAMAHGAMPHLGVNAIDQMNLLLSCLQSENFPQVEHLLLGSCSLNVGQIRGGVTPHMVPDRCECHVEIGTVPGQNHGGIVQQVRDLLHSLSESNPEFRGAVEVINDRPVVETRPDHPLARLFMQCHAQALGAESRPGGTAFHTDASVYAPGTGAGCVICGPGDPSCAHMPDEWVSIRSLEQAALFYSSFARRMLCRATPVATAPARTT